MSKHYLITGGAGFIGSNYVSRLLKRGENVTVYDNLSRAGTDPEFKMAPGYFRKPGVPVDQRGTCGMLNLSGGRRVMRM